MRPATPTPARFRGDAGASLVELVIAMGLTAVAMAAIVGLISSSSGTAQDIADDDPLAALAADWLANDLRQATDLDVVSTATADEVTRLDIVTPDGTVTWGTAAGAIERTAPGASSPQVVAENLRTTDALVVSLRTEVDDPVDANDALEVDSCARLVHIHVIDADDVVLHERTVSLRFPLWEASSC